jgi:hypothetical protein
MSDENRSDPLLVIADKSPTTVKIQSDETEYGYMIINESDFDRKTMKKYVEKAQPKEGE